MFEPTPPPPLPTDIGSVRVPLIKMSALAELTVPLSTILSEIPVPTVKDLTTSRLLLIVVVPDEDPILIA